MSEQLVISGSLKDNSFLKLKRLNKIQYLEISYANLDDDWNLIANLKELKSISIKDSFIDFQSFYKALSNLKKLEKITYNYYCYFNKKPKEDLKKIEITNKVFQIDFPEKNELNFDYNNYMKETYKNKFHSIFEIKNCEKIFTCLEKIIFNNYTNFDNLMKNYDQVDQKKLKKLLYWEMSPSKLSKFKKLKIIEIDQNNKLISFIPRINYFLKDKKIINSLIKVNNIDHKKIGSIFDNVNILNFNEHVSNNELASNTIVSLDKYESIIKKNNDNLCLSINTYQLFESGYGTNDWKIKNRGKVDKIFNQKIETIIFSDFNVLFKGFYSSSAAKKKIELFKKLFDNLENLKSIVFDFSNIEKSDITSSNFNFLTLLIYELTKKNKDINIIYFKDQLVELENLDWPKIHLIYLLRFVLKLKYLNKIKIDFFNLKENQIISYYEKYIFSKIRNLIVVDDPIYNISNKFDEIDIFYTQGNPNETLIDFQFENRESLIKKFKFGELYWDFFNNIYTNFFDEIEDELVLIVKRNSIDKLNLKNLNLENIEYNYNSPIDAINVVLDNQLQLSDKNLKKFEKIKNKQEFLSEKSLKIINEIKNFNNFKFKVNETKFFDSLKIADNFDNEFGLFQNLKKLKRFKINGYSPFYGKYILINKLKDFVSTEHLEELEIDGLIDHREINFPYLPKIKKIDLTFSYNEYNAMLSKDNEKNTKIENFSNLVNIQKLELRRLYEDYPSNLIKKIGIDKYSEPYRWHSVEIDFSDIHNLKKLKELNIYPVKSKDLKKIKELPSVESLNFRIFQITEEMNPDKGKSRYCPIIDEHTFSFLKNSKVLKKITLRIGDVPYMEDLWGEFLSTRYSGNADFLNHINYNLEELELDINIEINKQYLIQDIINNICNRFLKLKKLILRFGIVINSKTFDWENFSYKTKIIEQTLDFNKFIKLRNLEVLDARLSESSIKIKTINFKEIFKLKKLKELRWNYDSINFEDFRKARINFKNEKFEKPKDYDWDYDYLCEEDENYAKNWNRFKFINSDDWGDDWLDLEERFLTLEKGENKKKFAKKTIIQKKKN